MSHPCLALYARLLISVAILTAWAPTASSDGTIRISSAAKVAAQLNANAPWPRFHGNNANTGLGPSSTTTGATTVLANNPNGNFGSCAIDASGTIYVGSQDKNIYAINHTTGATVWSFATGGQCMGAPALGSNGLIYAESADHNLYALNASNGASAWDFAATSDMEGSPAIESNGDVVAVDSDGELYCVDGTVGNQLWAFKTQGSVSGSPAIGPDGDVYVGDSDGFCYCVNGSTGQEVWTSKDSGTGTIAGSPAVSGTTVFVCRAWDGSTGGLNAINTTNGVSLWMAGGSGSPGSPSIGSNQTVYFSCGFGLTAVNNTSGAIIWQTPTILASDIAVSANGNLYAGDIDGNFSCFNGSTGDTLWTASLLAVNTCPAFDTQGDLGMGDEDGNITVAMILGRISSFQAEPNSITGGAETSGVIDFKNPAPEPNGYDVTVTSDSLDVTVPSKIHVPPGATSVSFDIGTNQVFSPETVRVQAKIGGEVRTAAVVLYPNHVTGFYANPSTVTGGSSTHGVVSIGGPAESSGVTVTFGSSDPSVQPPASVNIPEGSKAVSFPVSTSIVGSTKVVQVTATALNSSMQASITVNPEPIKSFFPSVQSITGGNSLTGVIQLQGPAGPGGDVVTLSSASPDVEVPASVTVPQGATGVSFKITTAVVAATESVNVSAQLGASNKQFALEVDPPGILKVFAAANELQGGRADTLVLQLTGPAPAGGATVTMAYGGMQTTAATTVKVPGGAAGVSFALPTSAVSQKTGYTITASLNGTNKTCTVTIDPAQLANFYFNPNPVTGGAGTVAVVQLNGAAGPQGDVVTVADAGDANAGFPNQVTVPAGVSGVSFKVTTSRVQSPHSISFTATGPLASSMTVGLTLNPIVLAKFYVTPTAVTGGQVSHGVIQITFAAAAGGVTVNLSCSDPNVTIPSSVVVPANSTGVSFSIGTKHVRANDSATITATLGSSSLQATLGVNTG